MDKKFKRFVYCLLHRMLFNIKEYGKDKIEKRSYIIAPNHTSDYDGPLFWASFENISIMAKKECFQNKLIGNILMKANVMSVNRQSVIDANAVIDMAVNYLNGKDFQPNRKLMLFAQGTISDINVTNSKRIKKGAFVIAALSGAPIVPAFIEQPRIFQRSRMVYGDPMNVSKEDVYDERGKLDRHKLEKLKELWQKAVLKLQEKAEMLEKRPIRKLKLKAKHRLADAKQYT